MIMSKRNLGVLSILLVTWLAIWYNSYTNSMNLENAHKEIIQYQMQIDELEKPSQIELDEIDLKKAEVNAIAYWKLEAESKARKEQAIWKTRCIKKKIIWEEEECETNLEERFAIHVK